jgi:hypothetical protein
MLVALLFVAAAPAGAGDESIAMSAAQAGDAEHDALATALRPAGLPGHRTLAPLRPLRPVPPADAEPSVPDTLLPSPVRAPCSSALYALRTVVLLC